MVVNWCETIHKLFLFTRSKGHGSGCTTALSGMHRYLYRVYCLTPPASLCSDNTQNLQAQRCVTIHKLFEMFFNLQTPALLKSDNLIANHSLFSCI